jgi:hypothetical protein
LKIIQKESEERIEAAKDQDEIDLNKLPILSD